MDEPYKDRRARGEMICVRCGCFSSARTCYQCGIGIVITCGSCADLRAALAAAIAERDALREAGRRWKEYAEHQEHCATCGEAVSDCTEGSELRRRAGGEGEGCP